MKVKVNNSEPIVNHKTGETKSDLLAKLPVPGPGRKPDTEEQTLLKKSRKELIEDYKDALAEALPMISPVLIKKAFSGQGDIQAIREINDILVEKAPKNTKLDAEIKVTPILNGFSTNNRIAEGS